MTRRILVLGVTTFAVLLFLARPAAAHNTLVSSDPRAGAVLDVAPTQLTLVFVNPVPLDTLSIEMIDSTGVRSDLGGSTHGGNSTTVVLTPLPMLPSGEATLRWRLVGPDGHPITGRIAFRAPSIAPTTSAGPAVSGAAAGPDAAADGFNELWTTPKFVRWLLRFGSYLAIMTIGGVICTTAFVWRDAWRHPMIRRAVSVALTTTLVMAAAQLLVVASDITATTPWTAWRGISAALDTDAGLAFAIRIIVAGGLAWVTFAAGPRIDRSFLMLSAGLCLALLTTWAYAGHSASMRWSILGVPLDIAHHAAAAAWIAGLGIVGIVAINDRPVEQLIGIVNRFARLAATSVAVIVGTGALQSVRLVGSPGRLFAVNHGQYLVLKLTVLVAMLKVADINRERVRRRFNSESTTTPRAVENLRRAMGTELAAGLIIVGVTAVMVVSPPSVAKQDGRSTGTPAMSTTTSVPVQR